MAAMDCSVAIREKTYNLEVEMKNEHIQLIPADPSLAEEVANYYRRNREFLQKFEPMRDEAFFSCEYQRKVLEREMLEHKNKISYCFYIKTVEEPQKIIGMIGLSNVVWGAFCSAFMGYKLDEKYINKGYMSMAVSMLTKYAFEELHLHRIEANVMPRNKASLKVLEKNHFENEGVSKYYLNINGIWEDHVHMVKLNYDMHC